MQRECKGKMVENSYTRFYPRALVTFGGAHFLNDLVTTGLVPALVVLYKEAFQLSYTESSLIVLVSYMTSSISQPLFGIWTDKRPREIFLSLGVFLSILGLALTAIATSLPLLLVCIAISGLGSGMFHPEASRGTHLAAGGNKGLAQAIFQVGGNAGQAFGPLMIPLFLASTGIQGLLWFIPVAFLSLLFTFPILNWLKKGVQNSLAVRTKLTSGKNDVRGAIILILVILLRSWCQVGVVVFLPFFYGDLSLKTSELLNFLFVGSGAVGTFVGGLLSDKIGLKRILAYSMFLSSPFALLLPHVKGFWIVVVLLLFGFIVLSSFSVGVVYMQKLLPKNIAMASGLTIGFGVGTGGIGAVFMGGLADFFDVNKVFILLSFLPLIGGIIALLLPDKEQEQIQQSSSLPKEK